MYWPCGAANRSESFGTAHRDVAEVGWPYNPGNVMVIESVVLDLSQQLLRVLCSKYLNLYILVTATSKLSHHSDQTEWTLFITEGRNQLFDLT